MKSSGRNWLVKSGDKILGPFTSQEVVSKLKSKELVVIDEITAPLARWRLIRDEAEFKDVVEEIRRGNLNSREDTEIQGHTAHTMTQTETDGGAALVASGDAGAVYSSASPDEVPIDHSQVQDAEFVDSVEAQPAPRAQGRSRDVRAYGTGTSKGGSRKTSNFVRFMWTVALIIVGMAAILVLRSQRPADHESSAWPQDFDKLMADANHAWELGDFQTALAGYRKAERIKPYEPKVVVRMAPLLVQLESQTVQAKRALSEALAALPANAEKTLRSNLESGLGLAALASDDFNEASDYYKQALAHNGDSFVAKYGMAMVSYFLRNYSDAAERFGTAGNNEAALLLKTRSILNNGKAAKALEHEIEAAVRKVTTESFDFRQEAMVLLAAAKMNMGDKKAAGDHIQEALNMDPDMTSQHRHDPLLYMQPLSWNELMAPCRRVSEELKGPSARALLALCFYKSGNKEEATRTISGALVQWPEEQILEAASAYILFQETRYSDARAALKLAMAKAGDLPALAYLMQARLCFLANDLACAEKAWTTLSSYKHMVLSSTAGLAEIQLRKDDRAGARDLVEKVYKLSPRYKPILSLRESVGAN